MNPPRDRGIQGQRPQRPATLRAQDAKAFAGLHDRDRIAVVSDRGRADQRQRRFETRHGARQHLVRRGRTQHDVSAERRVCRHLALPDGGRECGNARRLALAPVAQQPHPAIEPCFAEFGKHRARFDRRELIAVAGEHQPGVFAEPRNQIVRELEVEHRGLVDDHQIERLGGGHIGLTPKQAMHREAGSRQAAGDLSARIEMRDGFGKRLSQARGCLARRRRISDAQRRAQLGKDHQQPGQRAGLAGSRSARDHAQAPLQRSEHRHLLGIRGVGQTEHPLDGRLQSGRTGHRRRPVGRNQAGGQSGLGTPQPGEIELPAIAHEWRGPRVGIGGDGHAGGQILDFGRAKAQTDVALRGRDPAPCRDVPKRRRGCWRCTRIEPAEPYAHRREGLCKTSEVGRYCGLAGGRGKLDGGLHRLPANRLSMRASRRSEGRAANTPGGGPAGAPGAAGATPRRYR